MSLSDRFNEDVLQDYVNKVCHRSRISADAIKIYLADLEKTETSKQEFGAIAYAEVLLEFVTFLLHFTDRCIFWESVAEGYIGLELRDNLMDELVERCINAGINYCFLGLEEHAKQEYKKSSFNVYNVRMEEYSKYKKHFPEKDEGSKGTLFWEFTKNICKLVGRDYDPALKMMCIRMNIEAIEDLDPKSFIKKVKK